MTTQKKLENKQELKISAKTEDEQAKVLAQIVSSPSLNAARIQLAFNPNQGLDLVASIDEMKEQVSKLKNGDTLRIESILLTQAHSLQTIFTSYALKMANSEYLNQLKVNGALALKAQSQCRQTLMVLAEMKNPKRATFINNQATNQQVNLHAGNEIPENKTPILSNELISGNDYATMDITGTTTASAVNSAMATVENGRS